DDARRGTADQGADRGDSQTGGETCRTGSPEAGRAMTSWNIAVLGLGIIGSRVAANLQKAEIGTVQTWNRTPKGLPGECASVEEAAENADLILLFLKDAAAVREVAARVFALPGKERILVNHATIDLATTKWLAAECAARGIGFLDCPFTGSREAAAAAGLVYYAGGPAE